MRDWLPHLVTALDNEIREIHRSGHPSRTFISGGEPVRPGSTATAGVSPIAYRTRDDWSIPTDAIGHLRLSDQVHSASVLQSEPGLLVLAVEHPTGHLADYTEGTFERDITDLTRRLRDLLNDPPDHLNWNLLAKTAGDADARSSADSGQIDGLSADQSVAVSAASHSEVVFLQGPPGTGKTHTIGYIVKSTLEAGRSILVTSHTHVAVDQALLASINAAKTPGRGTLIRIGTPRLPEVPETHVLHDLANAPDPGRVAVAMFSTLAKRYADPAMLGMKFDTVLIDEVSMVNAALAIPTLGGARHNVILVGDPHQLPPIVQAGDRDSRRWLGTDIFELCNAANRPCFFKLIQQRRMRPAIADISRALRYPPTDLQDHPTTRRDSPALRHTPFGDTPLVAVDSSLPDESVQWFEASAWNLHSAISAVTLAERILETGDFTPTRRRPVGIITPFAKQRMLLTRLCDAAGILDRVLPGTVHTFQGNEVDVAIFDPTITASTTSGRLRDPNHYDDVSRLMNVAVSRARDQLISIGDTPSLRYIPRSSGLGAAMAEFTGLPAESWDFVASTAWARHDTLIELLQSLPAGEVALVTGTKAQLDKAAMAVQRSPSGPHLAMLCTDDRSRPLSVRRDSPWIRWHDPAPPMVITPSLLAVANPTGAWISIDNQSVHKLITDFTRTTSLIEKVAGGESFRCTECGADLSGEQRRYGSLKGKVVLACPNYDQNRRGGCKGTIIVLDDLPENSENTRPPPESQSDRTRRRRIETARKRAQATRDRTPRAAPSTPPGVCRHRMEPATCPYCR